jgi:alanyl-tRNA synthetase
MTSKEIRQSFLDFFKERGHKIVPSAPVIPQGDPTLLFTNAGMNQFKDVFLGQGKRDYKRAADTQKCIRVSGKHNDLEEVGHDTYHHTFFEMLGNWSFGDYYKREAITWAWELLTEVWKLPKNRLYATVFRTDDETHKLWTEVTDIDHSHIMRFDEKDNFWEMGDTGPCGPCSEIHIDLTDDLSGGHLVNKSSPLVIELWNLVFIQHNRNQMGELEDLPQKHVDTGMGFERVCAVLQGKKSNYESDVFTPLLKRIGELCGTPYEKFQHDSIEQISMRVMADHIRTLAFAIADGAIPSNEDRGYVLRRILRRASRYARNLNLKDPVLYKLVPTIIEQMGGIFPEIREKQSLVERVVKAEEESFNVTLDRGIELFNEIAQRSEESESPEITGEEVFKLYDTFGFPVDLTVLMANEHGLHVDIEGFEILMEEQKKRSRKSASKNKNDWGTSSPIILGETEKFTGYEKYDEKGTRIIDAQTIIPDNIESVKLGIVLKATPFYVESGGQISDKGIIEFYDNDRLVKQFHIDDVVKGDHGRLHLIRKEELDDFIKNNISEKSDIFNLQDVFENLYEGKQARALIDIPRRQNIMRNHTATHIVHEALRRVLGTHLHQQGSLVAPDHLRFDFNHFEKISDAQLHDIEQIVNEKIRESIAVETLVDVPIEEAKKIPNAKMFFGDKYGDFVRVVVVDEKFSVEFCGGTHVKNTADIGYFKLIAEAGIASGMRRIEAVTGTKADEILQYRYDEVERLSKRLNVSDRELYRRVEELLEEKKLLEKELSKFKLQSAASDLDSLVSQAQQVNGAKVVAAKMGSASADELKSIGDALRGKLGSGVGLLASAADEKVQLVCVVTDDLTKKISAGKIIGEVAKLLGGSGGGRPNMATGGGKDVAKIGDALQQVKPIVERLLSN